jgi:hypothetical protein
MTHSSRLFPQKEANSLSILDRHGLAGFAIQTARLVNLLQYHLSLKMPKKQVNLSVSRGEKLPVSQGAGLTAKGRAKYNRETGSNLKAPAPNPKTEKDAARRRSFCARMSGMPGPMKDEKGRPTRKAASLKRWNCK